MWGAEGLAVSLPARELGSLRFPSSLFKHDLLVGAGISDELWRAVALVEQASEEAEAGVVYIARPEIFTHGESLRWIHDKLGSIRDHLSVSDGTAIRLLPGMRNHVFFYAPGRSADAAALADLERRAPEMFFAIESQVNSAFRFRNRRETHTPEPIALPGRDALVTTEIDLFPFYLNRFSVEESVARILARGAAAAGELRFDRVTYCPLTDASAGDPAFAHTLASIVAGTYFDQSHAVIIGLPIDARSPDALAAGLGAGVRAVQSANILIPAIPAVNVLFAAGDITVGQLRALSGSMDLLAHDTYDFWRHAPSFYSVFREIRVAARRRRHDPAALPGMLARLCGREAQVAWPVRANGLDSY
jgi:hypothetical protein